MGEQQPRRFRDKAHDLFDMIGRAIEYADVRPEYQWLPRLGITYSPVMSPAIARDIERALAKNRAEENAVPESATQSVENEAARIINSQHQQRPYHEQQGEI